MDEKKGVFGCLLLVWAILLNCTVAKEIEVQAHKGTNVTLPCRVDINQCGTLHSVKWYRETSRIYVFSQAGHIARGEGNDMERMSVEYNETENAAVLKISDVQIDDDATYKCEITYLDVRENCDVVQIVRLTTLVKPQLVRILGNDGVIENATTLKPKKEGDEMELTCEALYGKPIPTVSWYNGSQLMNRASYSAQSQNDGLGSGKSKLRLTLSRGDLKARFECRVESQALDQPMISWITMDVYVKPTEIKLSGLKGHAVQGSKLHLTCDVFGARPAATVKWSNHTVPIKDTDMIETKVVENADGTYTTTSTLVFEASRWENGRHFECYAQNEISKTPLEDLMILDVRYPPVITISAARTVVNETENVVLSCTYYANPQKLLWATWFKDGKNLTRVSGKHENGNVVNPTLRIKNVNRDDMGEYTCRIKNEIGEEESEESIFLDVHYPPDVEVIMKPSTPVRAVDSGNVSLECNVTSGNPPSLRKVRWFLGGLLMTELPECNYSQPVMNETLGGPFCGIDPSILSLIKVEENFAGNYTCQGENEAGYGSISDPQELVVYYPPTPAKLRYTPKTVIKKGSVTLECTVDHPGNPTNVTYKWFRGSRQIRNTTESNWTISPVSLATRSTFKCIAENEGGESLPASTSIDVLAPPAFIGDLKSYKGVLYSTKNFSLTCRIECSPLCSIIWTKDGHRLDTQNNPLYYVLNKKHPADYNKNDFESIESTLVWNMTNWPNEQLNKSANHSHYTCSSISDKNMGPHVNFTTEIAIDFPPEDLEVSKVVVNVTENEIPHSVKCSGKGRPKLNYVWKKNLTSEPIVKVDTLQLDKMKRADAGSYICEAYNKYGNKTIKVYFDVQYKPDCLIDIGEKDGYQVLYCDANANPQDVVFRWRIEGTNDTIDNDNIINEGLRSYLILDSSVDTIRTYQCIVNNSVGEGRPCEKLVPGTIPWYKRLSKHDVIVIIAALIALIICVIIVCIVIIVLCRKKRHHTKCNNPLEMEEREKFLCTQSPDVLGLPLVPCGRVTYLGNQAPNPSSTGDKMRLGAAPPVGGSADPANDHDKGFYENLPFHGMQNPPNKNAFYTLTTPHYKHLNVGLPPQYSATIPHQKHTKLIPRALFNEQLPKSKSFSSKPKHKKHFQIPLQKCHSFKFQTAESYFQPIKNIHEEDLMKNGYVSDYPESSRGRHHKREKPKQKTKGPLVLRGPNDYHENVQFPENVQNSVQLQYPQPIIGRSLKKPNGVVYADLDMPKTNNKKSSHETSSSQNKSQKSKPKTEYATLTFNDIGQEIDV